MEHPTRPPLLPVDENGLPTALRERCIWVVWRLTWNAHQQRWTKPPYKPIDDGFSPFASPSNPHHRWPLDLCLDVVHKGGADGVGIVTGNGLVAIDLDNCFDPDGNLKPWAGELVRRLNTYTEYSPSACGLHVIAFCQPELPNRDHSFSDGGKLQFFGSNHFCTLTGHVVHRWRVHTNIADVQDDSEQTIRWHSEIWTPYPKPPPSFSSTEERGDGAELLVVMFAARNGAAIRRLWEGDNSGYASASEADLALMNHLAFWCNKDAGRMQRLFEQSNRFRPGLKGKEYLVKTIAAAIASTPNGYQPANRVPINFLPQEGGQ